MLNMKKPELLAPAGNLEKLKTAINFGADAVYLGGSRLNLRAFADNFTDDELQEGIKYAHDRGRKVHVTINVFPRNEDFDGLEEYLKKLYEFNVDAIIVSDPGIIMTARETVPNLEIHLSTQANTVNFKTINFWYKQGVKRTVLARELTLEEIKTIREKIEKDCELEAFVHGSMCMSYSGRCLLSNYMTGRDSNRGACAQPCRYKYYLMEEKREGEYFPILEDDKGTYIMNSKDMCMIEHIPELVQSGIDSFKIEGRMKSSFYVATVVKAYREAIDAYFEDPENYTFKERWMDYLKKASHRAYFTGFYFNDPNKQLHESSSYIRTCDIVGIVKKFNEETMEAIVEQRNKVLDGDELEVLRPEGPIFKINIINMRDKNDKKIDSAPSAQMIFKVNTDKSLKENDILIKNK
ncbi:U32 family peptidase [Clostridium botulinum]|uniref:Peptidase, U32 family n=1 Tax=Clostridium botulinum (strain Okra / Type B1) TaxID=498213 RepID=B1IJ69_CLOBK|nr:U32 family peptidase [Clostridium botulinum]ACA46859.1 peptidase, U32 family [Clostridium botulinum B1 str. Okra]MBD5563332.1 U32 family peptidase [Clostridium botulinum]MBD5566994.1 U32 family peptidase [Clostridium botulinum]MBD5570393.1 U32 family peptidase [Clostridium botulinum]MBD5573893.1 U32 family peptidase [Clostridium botulinum]